MKITVYHVISVAEINLESNGLQSVEELLSMALDMAKNDELDFQSLDFEYLAWEGSQ